MLCPASEDPLSVLNTCFLCCQGKCEVVGLLLGQASHRAYVCVLLISADGLEENCGLGEMPWAWKHPSVMLCGFQSGNYVRDGKSEFPFSVFDGPTEYSL